ncbi:MAG TPA: ATP-dependent Clp protease adaptor ClpS [Bacteroidia bacterium]|nr:ATP-dependent Clp protease adaptor ClpS [Bacteroidia bacterium]
MSFRFSHQTEKEEVLLLEEELEDLLDLVIYNDDFNTFEFVIETLMKVCRHDLIQAEQCTMIIHNNGKCGVKRGTAEELQPMCEAILERGISAKIE